jgi:hypothetical protein
LGHGGDTPRVSAEFVEESLSIVTGRAEVLRHRAARRLHPAGRATVPKRIAYWTAELEEALKLCVGHHFTAAAPVDGNSVAKGWRVRSTGILGLSHVLSP